MAYTNFPNGITSMGVPTMGISGIPAATGNYWWVNSVTGSNGNPGNNAQYPWATIAYALTVAASGDVVVVAEGHTETVAAAAGIAQSTANVTVFGLGQGNQRPTVTFSTSTAATWTISAAGCAVQNIVGVTGIDQLVSPWVVSAAGVTMNVEWRDPSSSLQAIRTILTTAAADKLNVTLKTIGITSGGTSPVNAIRLVGGDSVIVNVDFFGRASTSVVEFLTTACTNVEVYGYFYNSGTALTKDVIDTVTGSTWFCAAFDGVGGYSIIGGSGAALAINTSAGGAGVPTADSTANTLSRDVIGNKTDASVYVPGTTNSIEAYAKGTADLQPRVAASATAVMVNGNTLFTVAGGPVEVEALFSVCITGNGATASTLQYSATPTSGSAQTISGASASLANATAGGSVSLIGTALATAALYNANGPNLGMTSPGSIIVPAGTITAVIGTGSTTGTWKHFLRYRPLAAGVTVS